MESNLISIFCCLTFVLFICEITLCLNVEESALQPESALDKQGLLMNMTSEPNINLENYMSTDASSLKTKKSKKRPGVSDIYLGVTIPTEHDIPTNDSETAGYTDSNLPGNSSVISVESLENKTVADNYSDIHKQISSTVTTPLIPTITSETADLLNKLGSKSILNSSSNENDSVESTESSESAESSEDSSEQKKFKKFKGSKITTKFKSKNAPSILLNNNNMTSLRDHNLYIKLLNETVSKKATTIIPTNSWVALSIANASLAANISNEIANVTFAPQLSKVLSKPFTASMGDIGDVGKGNSNNAVLISSIVAIICLCTLFGILAYKRIYAYWYRRHYSRVDFLIDGLYEM